MAFGQSSGPPATGKQVRELLELLEAAGHVDFRDARGPMGFTQRQAGGKFTRDEAEAFIEQLEAEADGTAPPEESFAPPPAGTVRPKTPKPPESGTGKPGGWRSQLRNASPASAAPSQPKRVGKKGTSKDTVTDLSEVAAEELAAELQRRGWVVLEP